MTPDWSNPKSQLSDHFTVHDALLLPSWSIYHTPSDEEQQAIIGAAAMMEQIREYLEKPLIVHCWIRPKSVNCPSSPYHGRNYNAAVGGALNSAHITGCAVDWNPVGMVCDEARALLEPKLLDFLIRMEDRAGSNWVHTDLREPLPGGRRFFKP